jgi:uncharacterized repeat protein (TIGR03803 family)
MKWITALRLRSLQQRNSVGMALGKRTSVVLALLCIAASIASASVTFKNLVFFNGTDGANPTEMTLVQGVEGELYGTTANGGAYGYGSVFKISSTGTLTTLWNFCKETNCPDGAYPQAGLTLVPGGDLYGTTLRGGAHGYGEAFRITPAGVLSVVYSFCAQSSCADGYYPTEGVALVQATDGNLYGSVSGNGGIFRLTLAGTRTWLWHYPAATPIYGPNGLMQASDGNFYLTDSGRDGYSGGNIWKITPAGKGTKFYGFCQLTNCADGVFPGGPLVQGANGSLYGDAMGGGKYNDGTFFELTLTGKLTTLHSFDYMAAGNLGSDPNSSVILGNDGNFYGVAAFGGEGCVSGCGTVFKMTPAGALTTLHELQDVHDGSGPWGLAQGTSGAFYGATPVGCSPFVSGCKNYGTVYEVGDGLAPFVELVTNYGPVGKTIDILGQGFTGATGVTFDGVKATFDNVSDTYMTVTVPSGALTGTVEVTTFTNTYKSNKIFLVRPQFTSFSPAAGAVGSTVTLTGVSLTQTSAVMIGGLAATFKVVSDKEVTAVVPAGAKNAENIVIATAGGSASKGAFKVEPHITSFSPTSGPVGTEVIIKGTTFTGASKVAFDGVDATSFEVVNDSQVDAIVPSGAKTGAISITTPGGTGTSGTNFTVN